MTVWNEIAGEQLRTLCDALGFSAQAPAYRRLLGELFAPWGGDEIPARPAHRSFVSDDHSPYEFSVAFGPRSTELRLLLEAQGPDPSPQASHEAALALTSRLAGYPGVDLARFESVRELFCPPAPQPPFSVWHAVTLTPGKAPAFKIYLNPWARGRGRARATVDEALRRLGLDEASRCLLDNLDAWGRGCDEFNYFSLDLSDDPAARVKVYSVHPGATADDIERYLAVAPTHRRGDVLDFCQRLTGSTGPFVHKPVTSCFSFLGGRAAPSAATVHLPVPAYTDSDALLLGRLEGYLQEQGLDARRFEAAVHACIPPALAGGARRQSYASLRREADGLRVTAYLTPGAFLDQPIAVAS